MVTTKKLLPLLAAVGALGFAASASAGNLFTIDPSAISSNTNTSVDATYVTGGSSELITATGANTATASGWIQFGSYFNGATQILGATSGLNNDYQMFASFDLGLTLTSGSMLSGGSQYSVDSANFILYADNTGGTTFVNPDTTPTAATINFSGSQVVLASGTLYGYNNTASINTSSTGGLGAALNATTDFALCTGAGTATIGGATVADSNCTSDAGSKYFISPVPFYNLALEGFNNAGGGVTVSAPFAAVIDASGNVDFKTVPEPSELSLLGLGLLGLGVMAGRRKKV